MNQENLLARNRQSLSGFWMARNARERKMLLAAGGVISIALLYSLFIDPALSGRIKLNKDLPALRLQVAQVRDLSKEAAALAGNPPVAIPALTRESIEAALARKGLKPQSLTVSGDTVQIKLASASFANTLGWLDEMQKTARLSVVNAHVTALSQPDMADVALTLRQQRND